MTSFCNCETCQRIKAQIKERKHPLCPFTIPGKDAFGKGGKLIEASHQNWATSNDCKDVTKAKWTALMCEVADLQEIENAIYERYTRSFQQGFTTKTKKLLRIYFAIRKALETDND